MQLKTIVLHLCCGTVNVSFAGLPLCVLGRLLLSGGRQDWLLLLHPRIIYCLAKFNSFLILFYPDSHAS